MVRSIIPVGTPLPVLQRSNSVVSFELKRHVLHRLGQSSPKSYPHPIHTDDYTTDFERRATTAVGAADHDSEASSANSTSWKTNRPTTALLFGS